MRHGFAGHADELGAVAGEDEGDRAIGRGAGDALGDGLVGLRGSGGALAGQPIAQQGAEGFRRGGADSQAVGV
jgi:hypothetical protein